MIRIAWFDCLVHACIPSPPPRSLQCWPRRRLCCMHSFRHISKSSPSSHNTDVARTNTPTGRAVGPSDGGAAGAAAARCGRRLGTGGAAATAYRFVPTPPLPVSLAMNRSIDRSMDRPCAAACVHPRSRIRSHPPPSHTQHASSFLARRLDQLHGPCRKLPGLPGPGQGRGLRVVPGGGRLRLGLCLPRPSQHLPGQLLLGHLHLAGAERAHLRLLPKLHHAPVRPWLISPQTLVSKQARIHL